MLSARVWLFCTIGNCSIRPRRLHYLDTSKTWIGEQLPADVVRFFVATEAMFAGISPTLFAFQNPIIHFENHVHPIRHLGGMGNDDHAFLL